MLVGGIRARNIVYDIYMQPQAIRHNNHIPNIGYDVDTCITLKHLGTLLLVSTFSSGQVEARDQTRLQRFQPTFLQKLFEKWTTAREFLNQG